MFQSGKSVNDIGAYRAAIDELRLKYLIEVLPEDYDYGKIKALRIKMN